MQLTSLFPKGPPTYQPQPFSHLDAVLESSSPSYPPPIPRSSPAQEPAQKPTTAPARQVKETRAGKPRRKSKESPAKAASAEQSSATADDSGSERKQPSKRRSKVAAPQEESAVKSRLGKDVEDLLERRLALEKEVAQYSTMKLEQERDQMALTAMSARSEIDKEREQLLQERQQVCAVNLPVL